MSIRILWRSTVFLVTLVLIYFAFPIFIVPSSLPAIKALFIENEFPPDHPSAPTTASADSYGSDPDIEIMELSLPRVPTLQEKIEFVKDLHQQGMDKILKGDQPTND